MQTPDEQFATVTVTRYLSPTLLKGSSSRGATTVFTITGSPQPMKQYELKEIPESEIVRGAIKVYTETELRTADEENGTLADMISWGGKTWKVIRAGNYATGTANDHYKVIAALQPPEEPAP